MKDRRIAYFRGVLDGLVESLDATVRVERWKGTEVVPEPLRTSAARLMERLGTANRLAADKFVGSPAATKAVGAITAAVRRLDTAFLAYRTANEKDDAVAGLTAEIDRVRSEVTVAAGS